MIKNYVLEQIKIEYEKKYQQIGNTHHYMKKTPKQTKTCLTDLISTHGASKPSSFDKSFFFNGIDQPASKPAAPIIYDEFIYIDKLTKKRIKMSDAKHSYETGRHVRKSSNSSVSHNSQIQEKKKRGSRFVKRNSNAQIEKQITDLNECFLMLKSTEMFKLNSLREKIFASVDRTAKNTICGVSKDGVKQENIQEEIKEMLSKKKKIRQILQDSVKEANITQFRKYYTDQNHKLNKKIVSMSRKVPRSFNKSNIEKIIQTLADAQKKQDNIYTLRKKEEENFEFPGERKLRSEVTEYMRKQIRNNGQYLVTPEKKKLLYERLYKNAVAKSKDNSKDFEDKQNEFTEEEIVDNSQNHKLFDDEFCYSKMEINLPSEKSIFEPIVNQQTFVKEGFSGKGLKKSLNLRKSAKEKKKTEYLFSAQRKERHRKENTWVDLTYNDNSRLIKKQSFKASPQIKSFLNNFTFSPCGKNREISMIKTKFQKNQQLKTAKLSLKQQRFLFMVENGLLFDVEKEILLNQDYLFIKDKNEDNLLHMCAKNHFSEMFAFIVERYVKCGLREEMRERWGNDILREKLLQKNKNNKNVFEVAKLYHAEEIIGHLNRLKEEMDVREYNW